MDLFCDIFRSFRVSPSGRRIPKIFHRKCIKKFYAKKCGYLARVNVMNKLKPRIRLKEKILLAKEIQLLGSLGTMEMPWRLPVF